MRKYLFAFLLVTSTMFCEKAGPDLLQMGIGAYDFHRSSKIPQLSLEYKLALPYKRIHSLTGALATFKASLYVYSGFDYDIFIGKRFVITPSFCGGVFFRGKGKDLGYPLEWRSSVEMAYVFKSNSRIGVQGYHISNGSFGWKNPGEETLLVFYALAL